METVTKLKLKGDKPLKDKTQTNCGNFQTDTILKLLIENQDIIYYRIKHFHNYRTIT